MTEYEKADCIARVTQEYSNLKTKIALIKECLKSKGECLEKLGEKIQKNLSLIEYGEETGSSFMSQRLWSSPSKRNTCF